MKCTNEIQHLSNIFPVVDLINFSLSSASSCRSEQSGKWDEIVEVIDPIAWNLIAEFALAVKLLTKIKPIPSIFLCNKKNRTKLHRVVSGHFFYNIELKLNYFSNKMFENFSHLFAGHSVSTCQNARTKNDNENICLPANSKKSVNRNLSLKTASFLLAVRRILLKVKKQWNQRMRLQLFAGTTKPKNTAGW